MPNNVPDELKDKFESCMTKVMAQGHDKQAAIAICYTSVVGKEARDIASSFTVLKQADGSYRWLMVSSNAYRDNDGEIVSLKAQEQDVARMDAIHSYGPLRWWHVPGLDIGACDFAATHGRMRVESGTFATKEIGANVAAHAGDLAVSLGFTHPATEPDAGGVYHNINVFERSLLPKTKAANPYTFVSVQGVKDMASLEEKIKEYVDKVFGGDKAKAEQYKAKIDMAQKEIEAAGVAFKETTTTTETEKAKGDMPMDEDAPIDPKTGKPIDMSGMSEEEKAACIANAKKQKEVSDPPATEPVTEEKPLTVGDLTPDEFVAVLSDWLAPVQKELKSLTTLKEQDATTLKAALETIGKLETRIAELEGGRSKVDIFRASRQGAAPAATLTPPGESKQEKEVKGGSDFMSWAVGGTRN